MHPVLVRIGSLKIHAYGVLAAIGILAAIWIAGREAARRGLDREKVYDMAFWAALFGIVGARLFHVLVFRDYYRAQPAEILKIWNGGLVFYGGFLAALVPCVLILRRHRMPVPAVADAAALGLPLGLAFGRAGCAAAGCCYGKITSLPWAVVFTNPASLAPLQVPLHPTQIYEALGTLAIFGVLSAVRTRIATPGVLFWIMLVLYGSLRSVLELFRDDPRGFVGPFSESQAVSAVLIVFAGAAIVRAKAAARKPPAP
jgi:phosphatidylglycerol---prolipoprotein diacylglyceryl transferase